MKKRYSLILISCLLLVVSCSRLDSQSAMQVVEQYCELDYQGTRISSKNLELWKKYYSLVTWDWEPGWDELAVIYSYKISEPAIKGRDAAVQVVYRIMGRFIGREYTPAKETIEENTYLLTWNEGGWKIKRGRIVPHISLKTWKLHLEDLISTQSDKEYVAHLQAILDKLPNVDE
jgi:hypothetical protein